MVQAGWPHGYGDFKWEEKDEQLWELQREGSKVIKEEVKTKPKKPVISIQERTRQNEKERDN